MIPADTFKCIDCLRDHVEAESSDVPRTLPAMYLVNGDAVCGKHARQRLTQRKKVTF